MRDTGGILPVDFLGRGFVGIVMIGVLQMPCRGSMRLEAHPLPRALGNYLPSAGRHDVAVHVRRRLEARDVQTRYPAIVAVEAILARIQTIRRPKTSLLDEGHPETDCQGHRR